MRCGSPNTGLTPGAVDLGHRLLRDAGLGEEHVVERYVSRPEGGRDAVRHLGDDTVRPAGGRPDDGFRASDPALGLQDMERDGIYASVIYGPSLFGLPIADQELKAACLVAYNDWANDFNAHDRGRLSVLPVLPTHTVEAAVAELGRIAKLGHRGVILSIFE